MKSESPLNINRPAADCMHAKLVSRCNGLHTTTALHCTALHRTKHVTKGAKKIQFARLTLKNAKTMYNN